MDENQYKTEFNDKGINALNLNKIFDLSNYSESQLETIDNDEKLSIPEIDPEKIPDNILHKNIEKANILLDKITEEALVGNMSGLMMQAAAKLIDSITTATTSLLGVNTQEQELEYKRKLLELKEKDILIKLIISKQKKGENIDNLTQNIQNNVIVSSREDILKMIKNNSFDTNQIFKSNC